MAKIVLNPSAPRQYIGWHEDNKDEAVAFEAYDVLNAILYYMNSFNPELPTDVEYDISVPYGTPLFRIWLPDTYFSVEDVTPR